MGIFGVTMGINVLSVIVKDVSATKPTYVIPASPPVTKEKLLLGVGVFATAVASVWFVLEAIWGAIIVVVEIIW